MCPVGDLFSREFDYREGRSTVDAVMEVMDAVLRGHPLSIYMDE